MQDGRRFLRYIVPGIIFATQTGILLLLIVPTWTLNQLGSLKEDAGIGVVLAAVLASGGLGYLFSVLHHAWHWRSGASAMDFRDVITKLSAARVLELRTADGRQVIPPNSLLRTDAWAILSTLWHERTRSSPTIEAAEVKAGVLTDLVHAAGSARVAAVAASVVVFSAVPFFTTFSLKPSHILGYILALVVAIGTVWVFSTTYARTARFAQQLIGESIADALTDEAAKAHAPIVTRPFLVTPHPGSEARDPR